MFIESLIGIGLYWFIRSVVDETGCRFFLFFNGIHGVFCEQEVDCCTGANIIRKNLTSTKEEMKYKLKFFPSNGPDN